MMRMRTSLKMLERPANEPAWGSQEVALSLVTREENIYDRLGIIFLNISVCDVWKKTEKKDVQNTDRSLKCFQGLKATN